MAIPLMDLSTDTPLDRPATDRLIAIVRDRGEPLSIQLIAPRFYEADHDTQVVPYTPDHAYLVGQRVVWSTRSYGRLIGDITSCELSNGRWRILVDWIPRLSPGLTRYRESRRGMRLAYTIDPQAALAEPEESVLDGDGDGAGSGPSVAELLEKDLEDHLRTSPDFASWAGLWAPIELLPVLDEDKLAAASREATLDDGVAQTDQIISLLGLPGPDAIGYGFAAMSINLRIQHDARYVRRA